MKSDKQKFSSIDFKKKVAVIKCFICNQMFYDQYAFDTHMQQHSSKLSKNIPEQIQRKTMESFKIKKNGNNNKQVMTKTMKSVVTTRASSVRIKAKNSQNTNNKTVLGFMSNIGNEEKVEKGDKAVEKKVFYKKSLISENTDINFANKETKRNGQQGQTGGKQKNSREYTEAMRESNLIISKIEEITKKIEEDEQVLDHSSEQAEEDLRELPKKKISQAEFIKRIMEENFEQKKLKIIDEIEFVEFSHQNQALVNYQEQYRYMKELERMFRHQKQKINIEKVLQIKLKIMGAIEGQMHSEYSKQQVYLTEKHINKKTKPTKIENEEMGYCSSCYQRIGYGQQCYVDEDNSRIHAACYEQDQ